MGITGTPTTTGDDYVTVTPTGSYGVIDGQAGNDTLEVNFSTLSTDVTRPYLGSYIYAYTDEFFSSVSYIGFEQFVIRTGSGDDFLYGLDLADLLHGGAGNDRLEGGLGADTINGGTGNDIWSVDYSTIGASTTVTLRDGAWFNVAATGAMLYGIEALNITTGAGNDLIDTSVFGRNDTINTSDGNDTIISGRGRDTINGGAGADRLVVDWSGISDANHNISNTYLGSYWSSYQSASGDRVDYNGIEEFDLTGGAGNDSLFGAGLTDSLTGNGGNDVLNGGQGNDTVHGGAGTDTWSLDNANRSGTIFLNLQTEATNSGATFSGIERINYVGSDTANEQVTALAGRFNDTISTGAGNDVIFTGRGADSVNGGDDTDTMIMDWSGITDPTQGIQNTSLGSYWYRNQSASGDRVDYTSVERFNLTGGAGHDSLQGGALDDTLIGNMGNDTLYSGMGLGEVHGGDGLDTWVVDFNGRTVRTVVNLQTETTTTGMAISGIEQIRYIGGSDQDVVYAQTGVMNDSFDLRDGNDVVITGRGVDTVNGGAGTDRMVMDWSGITDPTQGITYTSLGSYWYRFASNSGDVMDFTAVDMFDLTGGAGHDSLVGANLADTLVGNGGNDTLNSGQGAGVVDGGSGLDMWIMDSTNRGIAIEFDAAASQTAAQGGAIGLAVTGIEGITGVTGSKNDVISTAGYGLNDSLTTNAGFDVVNLGLGVDTVNAGDGTDRLIIDYSASTQAVSSTYLGSYWNRYADGMGNSVDYLSVERFDVTSGSGNDTLFGGSNNDTLRGNAGDDVLNSGAGKDFVYGDAGIDTWITDQSSATANISFAPTTTVGTLVGVGSVARDIENFSISTGTGNDSINLSALTGNDTLSTGGGNDTINVGQGHFESVNAGAGTDVLTADASMATGGLRSIYTGSYWYRLYAVDGSYQLDFTGAESLNLTGGTRNDRLTGYDGNDMLSGGDGVDILQGGSGNDVLSGGSNMDMFLFNAPATNGLDHITDAEAGDVLRLTGVTLNSLSAGTGGALAAGAINFNTVGSVTTLYVGLDATPGADFSVTLDGVFGVSDFSYGGSDIFLI